MTPTDWFRNSDWSSDIQERFLAKLARSRTQRDQYLVIQALTLSRSHPQAALQLVDLYFATQKGQFEDVRALSARAAAYQSIRNNALAVAAMKEILAIERQRPQQKTTTYVEYPYFVASIGMDSEFSSAFSVLEERAGDLKFPVDEFKWHAAYSIISYALRDIEAARTHAGMALDAAKIKKSGFRFHQSLGLVGKEHQATVSTLRQIYA
ncbi:hypothetical protein [Rhodoferax fermentans]|uniref:Uncharacterized protein n=1 Tax=Rhodoferax fermentans TaxID=28066 RepID=A0A1T1AYA3_RHOFE|nr:hypothetical protein [Rhodoferax fermentans]MBK1683650.1 hypothetical protein [Rhodoferax fermentans]OOV08938.1 hypothetical protein RF819_06265 [Rhodoferax fermentans]